MEDEKSLVIDEWLQYAIDDLESAKLILEKSDNYHISVYHSHQAVEKIFKWVLLKNDRRFPFIHDLKELFRLACEVVSIKGTKDIFEDIYFLDDLLPQLIYPTGEKVTSEEAHKSLIIAEKICQLIRNLVGSK
ncbi:HEPN domain-containing protein [Candidatus Saganbacteria bacterium]|nr:HEPN domain-containing protein [Candidatus Saganbacteria bacterium]